MRVTAVVPAFNNEQTIEETVRVLLSDSRLQEVVVIDDASRDETVARARAAGARVTRMTTNRGKGEALSIGLANVYAEIVLMVDGDTGESARGALDLIDLIEGGEADMAVGVLPAAGRAGGFGIVKRFAALLIQVSSGFRSEAPLSGQRAVSMEVLEACAPLAGGFGVDSALTSDAVRGGFRVIEVPVDMTHDHRGRSARGFVHRARQGIHLLRAFIPRLLWRTPASR